MRTRQFHRARMAQFVRRFAKAERGGAMTMFAILLPTLIGFAALGVDVAMWLEQKREAQSMADAGAIAATYVQLDEGSPDEATDAACLEANRNGLNDNCLAPAKLEVTDASDLDLDSDLSPGYRVTVTLPTSLYFMGMFLSDPTVQATAVGGTRDLSDGGPGCIWALSDTRPQALYFTGNTTVNVGCNLYSNSNSSSAIEVWGSANVSTTLASTQGDILIGGSGNLTSTNPVQTHSTDRDDPFASAPLSEPPTDGTAPCLTSGNIGDYGAATGNYSISGTTGYSVGSNKTATLGPKTAGGAVRICGGMDIKGTLTLQPGVYFIDTGSVSFGAQANITGNGVTIVQMDSAPSTGNPVGSVDVNGGATVNLRAPTDSDLAGTTYDDYQGMAWVIKADGTGNETHKFNGGANFHVNGLIYSSDDHIEYSGNSGNTNSCTLIFADTIKFTGNSGVYNDTASCGAAGVDGLLIDYPMLTEARVVVLVE